jgi:hypothetical protein
MTPEQLKSTVIEITEIHFPLANPEQARMLRDRLAGYDERTVMDAVRNYAKLNKQLHVEKLIAAVGELVQNRDTEATRQRRLADAQLMAEIEEENRRVAAALDPLSDAEWAELVAEMKDTVDTIVINGRTITGKQGTFLGATFWARGRKDRAVRWMVYKHLKKHAHRRQEVMA